MLMILVSIKCDQASELWQQLKLASELESDLRDTVDWSKSKSDINLLVKYWWFKNNEISLAENHFCLYLITRFFPSMQFSQDVNEP